MNESKIETTENSEKWLEENKDIISQYQEYKNSDKYQNSPMKIIQDKLQRYMEDNKYYETAIPLIRKFSKSLYFVFEQPIHLYPNMFEELSRVRKHWIDLFWNSRVTYLHEPASIQYETLTQGFRAIGSKTRLDDTYVLAFETGEKHSIESFNEILSDENKISLGYKSTLTREEAKKLYPDWYQRRIVEGKPKKSGSMVYYRHRGIYDNWKEKILEGAIVGKRYFCLENLCSLAVQCQISPEEIEKDCRTIMMSYEKLTNDDKTISRWQTCPRF